MKKIIAFFLLLLGLFLLPSGVHAQASAIEDGAGLLTPDEITSLDSEISKVNENMKGQLFVVTSSTDVGDIDDYSENYLDEKLGNSNNGAVLAIDMSQRKFYIYGVGNFADFVNRDRHDKMLDAVEEDMRSGDYSGAASSFVSMTQQYIDAGLPGGQSYTMDPETGEITVKKGFTPLELAIAFIVATVAGLAVFFVNRARYQLKFGDEEYDYRANSSLNLTEQSDQLVNSFVTTRHIPRPSNNNGGGGGGGGGSIGGGRSF